MAATDQHYRNQKALNVVFAVSCVAMFASVIWMMMDDYTREYKKVQRDFRDVEEGVSMNLMLDALPNQDDLEDARTGVNSAKDRLKEESEKLTSRRKELVVRRDKAYSRFSNIKADYDALKSRRDIAVDHVGHAQSSDDRAASQKHLDEVDKEVVRLKAQLDDAQTKLDEANDTFEKEITSVLRPYEDELARAEDYLKKLAGDFDRFAKLTAEKKWKAGDTFRDLPIVDALNAPTRINQIVLYDLPIEYGSFKEVTRYDRCASCHLGIDRGNYTREVLREVADVKPPEKAIAEYARAINTADAVNARSDARLDDKKATLKDLLDDVRAALKQQDGLVKAVTALAAETSEVEKLLEPASQTAVKNAMRRLDTSAKRQSKLWKVHEILDERKNESLTFNPKDVPKELRELKLTPGQITQFAAHPRLDLFVDGNSPHPMEKFGCTICHSGQGSSTSFTLASHSPNDAAQQRRWEAPADEGYNWKHIHDWEYSMNPKRFTESGCLKCHHQVTDLIRFGSKEEAPKLLEGYNLVKDNGCFGCHEIAGARGTRSIGPDLRLEPTPPLEWLPVKDQLAARADTLNPPGTLRKVGPSLRRLVEKSPNPNDGGVSPWLLSWIKNPRGFRPDTKMPHFYGQSTNNEKFLKEEWEKRDQQGNDQSAYPDAEVYSIAYYLQSESSKHLQGEDGSRESVRQLLATRVKELEDALTIAAKLQTKQRLTAKDKMQLSEEQRRQARVKKDLDALRRRYRDLSLLSRPMHAAVINDRAESLQQLLDRTSEPLNEAGIKELFGRIAVDVKALQDASMPLAVQSKKDYLIDSTGRQVAFADIPAAEANTAGGRDLFMTKGCLACHSHAQAVIEHDIEGEKVPEISDAHFGPELSRIAVKLHPDKKIARSWLIQWVLNPNVHHPRTKMPITQLSVAESAKIADWLLSASSDSWKPDTVKAPARSTLEELATLTLAKVPIIGRQNVEQVLKSGVSSFLETLPEENRKLLAADADERILDGTIDDTKLMRYVGKKAIGRQGCYACHDIPGFESSKPIGTALNDWGKKDPQRLAFEDAGVFLDRHFNVADSRDGEPETGGVKGAPLRPEPSGSWYANSRSGFDAKRATEKDISLGVYEKFYADALKHQRREGFLSLKLAEPRSYDYNRVREWDDRLRMPQFKFSRTHRRGKDMQKEKLADYRKRRNEESTGWYRAETEFEEARAREAVMTFILGLVAENVPLKFVNAPKAERLAEARGREVLDKFNCAGCHEVRPGMYEFNIPEAKKKDFLSVLESFNDPEDHVFPDSTAWAGRPSPIPGRLTAFGVSADDHGAYKKEDDVYRIHLTEAFPYIDSKGATRSRPAGEQLDIPAGGLLERSATYGGDFARLAAPHLGKMNNTRFGDRTKQRSALPPPLLREGERVQPQWLFRFLRDPYPVRPWTVLRMPKFNMTDDEARALVEYFAAADKLNNPGEGLNEAFAEVPQRDWSWWQQKNRAYVRDRDTNAGLKKHLAVEREDLPTVWKRSLEDRVSQKERDLAGVEAALKNAKKDEEATIKGRRDDIEKELKALKDEQGKKTSDAFTAFGREWESEQVYAGDAHRIITDSKSICVTCHSGGGIKVGDEQGPNLDMAHDRLRPRWTFQWIANPKRLSTYAPTHMPQNFPNGKDPSPKYIMGTPREHAEAARDVLMNLPEISKLPVNRYRLAPKGGK